MRPLRAAALVMLVIAAFDGVINLIEYIATIEGLWRILSLTAVAVFVLDLIVDRRTFVGKKCHAMTSWCDDKLHNMLQFIAATSIGSGVIKENRDAQEDPATPAGDQEPNSDSRDDEKQ